ncbi:MAG: WbuC family cupin fold metalloprotein [Bacteroidaceae bacterium]|nr:WbuC family cupin fold metalloprotein [Bacteroidaceae bacterium]MBQ4038444.1 WbuC family cupin fold metalloprotein [Bacteroidaceae bacterium]
MKIDKTILDELTAKAKTSDRLRMNLDMRTSSNDTSQRMLNAVEPGTIVPIHRHCSTAETVIIVRGKVKEIFYDDNGNVTEEVLMELGGECPMVQIPAGMWHTIEALESGSVIFEAKDGAFAPLSEKDVMNK